MPPALQGRSRRAAVLGGNFQRPAEMLARVPEPNAQAVMAADLIVERSDMVELLGKRRRRFRNSTFQLAGDLPGQPGLTLRTTSDHHGIGAGQFERSHSLVERGDVAVDHGR